MGSGVFSVHHLRATTRPANTPTRRQKSKSRTTDEMFKRKKKKEQRCHEMANRPTM